MKLIKILAVIASSIAWFYAMETSFSVGNNFLPPLGKFLHPYIGFWNNVRMVKAKPVDINLRHPMYSGEIYFSDRMVPHIVSDNWSNAYFLQGYVHGMMRLWQMDFATRAAEGRISEIVGPVAIDFDKVKRRKGLAESARASDEVWKRDMENYPLVEAYSAGVNQFIDQLSYKDLPFEYKLLNYKPEKWSPYRSSLFHKNMAEILCGRDVDIELTNAKKFFGKDFNFLFPEIDALTDPVIPTPKDWGFPDTLMKSVSVNENDDVGYFFINREYHEQGLGSNNWAVGPRKSANMNPILCNDPHLNLTLPSIWFEQQIMTNDCNVYGVTFPGIPSIVIGFNQNIAWGVTNAGWDLVDWYTVEWKDESKMVYKFEEEWKDVKIRIEDIKVRNGMTIKDTVKITDWGPIVYKDNNHPKRDLAMHWIIHEPSETFELNVFRELNRAANYEDYRKAISSFPYPAQNFAFAAKDGDIAMTVQGKMPLKSNQDGRFVENSSSKKWTSYLSPTVNPHCKNPPRGFVSSANQRSTDLSFPNYYNDGDFRDYRGNIINNKLRSKEKWTTDDMKAMQMDAYSLKAALALPYFLHHLSKNHCDNAQAKPIIASLQDWDYQYSASSKQPVYFEIWMNNFYALCWDEITKDSSHKHIAIPSDQRTIDLMIKNNSFPFFDFQATEKIENAYDIIQMAFDSVIAHVSNPVEGIKNWAEFKNASISHMARIPAFGVNKLNSGGTKDVINAHAPTFGPSWRMVVELSKDGPIAYGVYPGGQHGHPGHAHYKDMVDEWEQGKHFLLFYAKDKDQLVANSMFKIQLHK